VGAFLLHMLPGDFFGFGVRGKHAFTAEALADDTVIARYPVSRMETLAAADAPAAGEFRHRKNAQEMAWRTGFGCP
jgi:hypothetical protein